MFSLSRSAVAAGAMLLASAQGALSATVTYDWNITWVIANPDGAMARPVIGINGQWPLPVLNLTKGDQLIAHVRNELGNESTSVHWHGMYQNGTNYMDGPPMVTQCNIPPGGSMTYNFTLNQTGTYWYHSHTKGQYPDGLRQALVIQDPESPYAGQYDEDVIITLSDWYHDQMPGLLKTFINVANPTGAEPVPKACLINDTTNFQLDVQPGKTYLMHISNVGAFAGQYFWIEGHTLDIVEVDGVWVNRTAANMIYLGSAQRAAVLITMKNTTDANYAIVAGMDSSLFDTVPASLNYNGTGWLVYNQSASLPNASFVDTYDYYDDTLLVPTDGLALFGDADYTITLDLTMNNLIDGANYAFFNDITYTAPKVPTLYSVLSAGGNATNPTVYGYNTNPFVLNHGDVVDIVLNNDDTGTHPFHLHGHVFQVLYRSGEDEGHWDPNNTNITFPAVPVRRDTLVVQPTGNFIVRFRADNPGVWLFHCHIEWHMDSGLAATIVEAPLEMQERLTIPADHLAVCAADKVSTTGNAAGNTKDYLDLTGQNLQIPWLPSGFTPKGYAALVISCVVGVLGVATIVWYGSAPIRPKAE